MSDRNIPLREWMQNYRAGKYNKPDRGTQIDAGWYDWFCSDSALLGRLKRMAPKVFQIADSPRIDQENMYVFFKNNAGSYLYDDFRICDRNGGGGVIFTVIPAYFDGNSEVWGRKPDGEFGKLVKGTWDDVMKFFYPASQRKYNRKSMKRGKK